MTTRPLPNLGSMLRPVSPPAGHPAPEGPAAATTRQPAKEDPAVDETPERAGPAQVADTGDSPAPDASADATDHVYLVPRQVYLPRSIHARARQYSLQSGIPVTEMIVTALSDMHAAVPAYLQRERVREAPPESDLYPIPQRARRIRKPDRQVQTSIRVTDRQLNVMDQLALRYSVNRSKLLAVCLELWLAERAPAAASG